LESKCFSFVVSANPQSQIHNIKENDCNNEYLHGLLNFYKKSDLEGTLIAPKGSIYGYKEIDLEISFNKTLNSFPLMKVKIRKKRKLFPDEKEIQLKVNK